MDNVFISVVGSLLFIITLAVLKTIESKLED